MYTPIVCAIALLVAVVPPLAIMLAGGGNEWGHWIYTALSLLVGAACGAYDGLIGPGAGTFLIIGFTAVLGTDLLVSSACGRVANLASNLTSMVIYIAAGKVAYLIVIPAAVACGLGYYAGSGYAMRGGSKNVRKIMFAVLALLFVKVGFDLAGAAV